MAKKLLTVLIVLFLANTAIAQNLQIKGVVKDLITNEVIGQVSITTQDQKYGTVSNDEGAFSLSSPESSKAITLTHLNYTTLSVDANKLPADGIFLMEPQQLMLDEIVIMGEPIQDVLNKLITTSMARFTAPLLLSTYYREFVKINDNYTKFADALIDYNARRKGKKLDTEVVVKQSRAAKLPGEDEENIDIVSPLDVRKAVEKDYNFAGIHNVLLDKKEYKKYDFLVKVQQGKEGQKTHSIIVQPKDDVQEALFEGTITYDPEQFLILNVDLSMAESHKKYIKERNFLIIKASLEDMEYKSAFKIVDDKYLLSFSSRNGTVHIRNKRTYNDNITFKSDLIVTNFTSDLSSFNKKERYKDKALYDHGSNYTENFWLKNNSLLLTKEEERIIKSIENKQ
ncbi:carboxypeptidase-like regulatory domain-containing protein [Flavobacterium cerinum]|uniref:Carboxypeptidase-like regulatory domain-containing protein n=1 Tax=Flavobacterium cerinum TaxID=2502784 RepID=A0A444H6S4_9FLAO|nr:carboxypeptidase-like regulatory domain-containing protein [Flavobacterium cerinum]RWW98859.1 carboxypeptidase-like regulatory domain-containing protein [Flavobacterium cerinum]